MHVWQAVFYIAAILCIAAAAFSFAPHPRVSLALLGAAFFVLAFSLPVTTSIGNG